MTEPTEPLQCPFCGGAASLHNDTDSPCWFVGCSNSTCSIEPCHYADTKAGAIATWNRRTPQPTQTQAGAVPLTDEQLWANDEIMSLNADLGWHMDTIRMFTRAIERAHGIKGGQHGAE